MCSSEKDLNKQYRILEKLNFEKMDNNEIQAEINKLFSLRAKPGNNERIQLKTAKGTQDFTPSQMIIREKILDKIINVFKKHGAESIDTPVFERKEILTGKYGEESKLIYDLVDQGGELLSLRYDLTVPFARYLASRKINNMKRYHIGKVYRRDNPAMNKGRFREFMQCDFDIAGDYSLMVPDAELLRIVYEIFSDLNLSDFTIKINSRKLLDGLLESFESPPDKFATICSSIDKLDKISWEEVSEELIEVKEINPSIVNGLKNYVKMNGGQDLIINLLNDEKLCSNSTALEALKEIKLLFEYCESFGITSKLNFDLSLARGLDYYTGLIFEVKFLGSENGYSIGSVAGGGRYDNLVNMFHDNNERIPCVGFSVGVERLFSFLENSFKKNECVMKTNWTHIFVITISHNKDPDLVSRMTHERIKLCRELFDAGLNVEFSYKTNLNFKSQKMISQEKLAKLAVIVGEDEINKNFVVVQKIESREEIKVPRNEMTKEVKRILKEMDDLTL